MSGCDGGADRGDGFLRLQPAWNKAECGTAAPDCAALLPGYDAYFFAGACGGDGGTVSISLPENTGAEVGWPLGEPPACSSVTA